MCGYGYIVELATNEWVTSRVCSGSASRAHCSGVGRSLSARVGVGLGARERCVRVDKIILSMRLDLHLGSQGPGAPGLVGADDELAKACQCLSVHVVADDELALLLESP